MNQLFSQLIQFIMQYSIRQRIIMSAVLIGFLSAIISLVLWANRTEYELLYSNLDPASASSIVDDLRSSKVKYKLENGGTTIYAPRESISELRLKYVQSGYIKDAVTGYELFEKNNMGMTTFMQKLNLRRALEGELMRTINQFSEVRQSRVHLVMPEGKLFEDDNNGSASIVLHLKPGSILNSNQINGISALVANSVDGVEAKDVVVMDSDGNILVESPEDEGVIGSVGNQYELQNSIESNLQKKVTEMVEGIVGRKNAVVKVSTELNFDQLERTTEEIDPDNVVVLSEEKYTEVSTDNIDSSNCQIEKATTNYEISKKSERYISNTGNVKRLTIAVLVNGSYITKEEDQGEKTMVYVPREEREMQQIEALVKSAVGYSEERGDIVEVRNLQFTDKTTQADRQFFEDEIQMEMYEKILTYVLMAIGLLLGFFLLKGLLKTSISQLQLPAPAYAAGSLPSSGQAQVGGQGQGQTLALPEEDEIPEDMYIKKLSPEARAKLRAKDKMTQSVVKFAEESPENATKLLRSWMIKKAE